MKVPPSKLFEWLPPIQFRRRPRVLFNLWTVIQQPSLLHRVPWVPEGFSRCDEELRRPPVDTSSAKTGPRIKSLWHPGQLYRCEHKNRPKRVKQSLPEMQKQVFVVDLCIRARRERVVPRQADYGLWQQQEQYSYQADGVTFLKATSCCSSPSFLCLHSSYSFLYLSI